MKSGEKGVPAADRADPRRSKKVRAFSYQRRSARSAVKFFSFLSSAFAPSLKRPLKALCPAHIPKE
jgi:hypothetical protein